MVADSHRNAQTADSLDPPSSYLIAIATISAILVYMTYKRWLTGLVLSQLAGCILLVVPVIAQVSQIYRATAILEEGTLVSLAADSSDMVDPATPSTAQRTIGVVIDQKNSSISLGEAGAGRVAVVQDGVVALLVHDLNGPIEVGDSLAVSYLAGVATKATNDPQIIGIAQAAFSPSDPAQILGTATIELKGGDQKSVKIGKIQVAFEVGANPDLQSQNSLAGSLQGLANSFAGKAVSPARVVAACLVVLVTFVVSGILLSSAIRSSLTSIGRNPLSHRSIYHGMLQVSLVSLLVIAAGIATMYLVLKA